ncbi:MAG: DUF1156 domain-containing protein, partial [Polyangiaceae bacterium]|nr:DUF1156 domain-containing protein [Polyangiaceae bacterium]
MNDRRLIEDSLPLAKISEHSSREKSIVYGHTAAIHRCGARPPLAAARAVTMAALLPAPRDDDERKAFHKLIVDNLDWELGEDPIRQARNLREIMRKHAVVKNPKILDPFAGSGTLPLEASRIGARAHATDLNPVAHLVELATLYYPQRFAYLPEKIVEWNTESGHARLISETRRWSQVLLDRVSADIAPYYPIENGQQSLFYIWARTAPCQNPSCQAEIPLVSSFILQENKSHTIALVPTVGKDRKTIVLDIVENPEDAYRLSCGTIYRYDAVCLCCQQT